MARPVKCDRCGRDNDPRFTFCLDCGKPLRAAAAAAAGCSRCGSPLQAGFRFCAGCGAPTPVTGVLAARPERPAPIPTPPAPSRPPTRLFALRTDGQPGASFALDPGETVCGRTEGGIRLAEDFSVSPRHARFVVKEGRVSVEDLGSLNGLFVRVRGPREIGPGQELRLGRQWLRLEPMLRPTAPGVTLAWGSPDQGCRLRLVQLLEGGGVGEVHPLREGENAVGREAGDVTFPGDRYVSGRHARLDVTGGAVLLTDLGSSNGTFVKVEGPAPLTSGDQLLVGTQLLQLA